jgi:glutathione S-transferase
MSLVFYYTPMSTAETINWALKELEIPYEEVRIDLKAKDQDKSGYRALNPNGKVPLLVHDGVPIFESAAIMIHLGETFGVERDLFPAAGLERAIALKWLVWTNVALAAAVIRFADNVGDHVPADQHNEKAAAVAREEAERLLGLLDSELAEKRFVLGDSFSLVDVHLGSFMMWIGTVGFDTKRWPNLHAWFQRCLARPSLARLHAA